MKKLFVLFLLAALVPFAVGCNGLWDFDDDDDAPVSYKEFAFNVKFPGSTFAAKALDVELEHLSCVLEVGTKSFTFRYKEHKIDGSDIIITFVASWATVYYDEYLQQIRSTSATIAVKWNDTPLPLATSTVDTSGLSDDSLLPEKLEIDFGDSIFNDSSLSDIVVDTFNISSVTYEGVSVSQSSTEPTIVATITPTFEIIVDDASISAILGDMGVNIANDLDFEVLVKNETTGVSFTLSDTDGLSISVNANGSLSVTVVGTNTRTLRDGHTYSVAITSLDGKNGDPFGGKKLALPGAYYFKVELPQG